METVKKHTPAIISILLFTLLNCLYFIYGIVHTPPGTIFTGAVKYAPDYFYYLSFISQGATRMLTAFHLFTGETTTPTLVGWYYTLAGHLFLPLGVSPISIYLALVIAMSLLSLSLCYVFITKLFPTKPLQSLTVFMLFLTANTFPTRHFLPISAWYNFGEPFERLTYIPHHQFFEAAAILAILMATDWWLTRTHPWRMIVIMCVIGFVTSSLQPALWMVMVLAIGIASLWKPKNIFTSMLPAAILGISGLPVALYLRYYVYTLPVFTGQLTLEPGWQVTQTVFEYIKINGPLVVLAILGLPVWLSKPTRYKIVLTTAAFVSLALYFSPVGPMLHVLNIRFLSIIPTLFFASVAGVWLFTILSLNPRAAFVIWTGIIILIAYTLPLTKFQLEDRNQLAFASNLVTYLPSETAHAFAHAQQISTMSDLFLVPTPYDTSFPGLTGRRIFLYWAVPYWTLNYYEKKMTTDAFYFGTMPMTDEEKQAFLKENHISYVLFYTNKPPPCSGLQNIYATADMTIYKVLQ